MMHLSSLQFALLVSAGLIEAAAMSPRELLSRQRGQRGRGGSGRQSGNGDAAPAAICVNPALIQAASDRTGQEPGTEGIKPGQAESAT